VAFLARCDGPDCAAETNLDHSLGWVTVEGADIHVLHFCGLLCCARFMSTSVAFITEPVLPFGD
jgi:hypothetical protein